VPASESTDFDALHDFLPDFIEQSDWDVQDLLDRTDAAIQQIRSGPESDSAPDTDADLEDHGVNDAAWTGFGHMPESLRAHKQPSSSLPWIVLGIGLAVFVCGGILTAWALLGQRPELWPIGIPLLVAGQMAILVVVVWQFDAVWHADKATFRMLHGLDDRVHAVGKAMGHEEHKRLEPSESAPRLRTDASHSTADTIEHWLAVKQQLDALRNDIQASVRPRD